VWKKRQRIQASASSSQAMARTAAASAVRYWEIRKGRVCRIPPRKVPRPVIAPRSSGLASPAMKAVCGWWVAMATDRIGARVDS